MRFVKSLSLALVIVLGVTYAATSASRPDDQPEGQPAVVSAVAPAYPPIARSAGATGKVVVEVKIDPSGEVSSAKGSQGHPILNKASELAARRWKFAPAKEGTASRTALLAFSFRLVDKKDFESPAVFVPPYKVEVTDTFREVLIERF